MGFRISSGEVEVACGFLQLIGHMMSTSYNEEKYQLRSDVFGATPVYKKVITCMKSL